MGEVFPLRLAVLLHADVAGSTSLVRLDEQLAHERMQSAFRRFSATISTHGGTAHEVRGDALVAEFSKVSDAVRAALAFQAANAAHNKGLSDGIRPEIRIGIAMGEVIVADNTMTGEGVVLAQRLEQLAKPGGVCIQGAARETVPTRLQVDYEDLGELEIKGFDQRIRVYAVSQKSDASIFDPITAVQGPTSDKALAKKPSIAVLSFENMSDDPDQEYFADGIAEDITTALSKLSQLFVIDRNSSFTYKGRSVKVQEIAAELDVSYVLEGSVRKLGNRARITSQLIDSTSGGHLWAEKFDRNLTDIFEVQDDVTQAIVSAIAVELTADDRERLASTGTKNLEAYDCFLRGRQQYRLLSKEGSARAETLLSRAISLDSGYATAFAYLAYTYLTYYVNRWKCAVEDPLEHAHKLARKAMELDEMDPHSHLSLGKTWMWKRRHDEAIMEHEKTIALDPNFAVAYAGLGLTLDFAGRPEEAIELIHRGMCLDPHYPVVRLLWLAQPNFQLARYNEAVTLLEQHLSQIPDSLISRALLAASYGHTGRTEEARAMWQKASQAGLDLSLDALRHLLPYKDSADFEKIVEGLNKADLV